MNFEADLQRGSACARGRHGERLPRRVREALCETAEPPGPGGPGRGRGVCAGRGGGGRGASQECGVRSCMQCTHQPERQVAGSEKREASGMWGSEAAGVSGSGPRGFGGLAVMQ